ncbi:MAG: hypothetical protein R3324_09600 [Halobacteriales archaeon]|nr:hypothetical protein [Halobacteriales archaeon]
MSHTTRVLVTIATALAVSLTGFQPDTPADEPVVRAPAVDIVPEPADPVGLDIQADAQEWHDLFEWAESRFSSVGLEMPAALVTVTPGEDRCGGNAGRYRPGDVPEVHICVDRDPASKVSKLIVLHELAHLWAENRMDDSARAEFLAVRGLDSWIDFDIPPHEWGAEHVAEVLSWGLMDESVRIIRIYDASPEALTEAFGVVTGTEPLVPLET